MTTELFAGLPLVNNQQELDAEIARFADHDPRYVANGCRKEFREYWELLWKKFKPFADKHFLQEIKLHFPQRAWEMYMGNLLLDYDFSINSKESGPDFIVGDKLYVECIVPTLGCTCNKNSVPPIKHNCFTKYPENEIKLRLTQSFIEKFNKYNRWNSNGDINPEYQYIIAISYGWLNYPEDKNMPLMLKVLFSVSDISIDLKNYSTFYEYDNSLTKSDSILEIGYFENMKYNNVSGVLFSNGIGSGVSMDKLGDDCFLVKNPYAVNPITDEIFAKFNRFAVHSNDGKSIFKRIMR